MPVETLILENVRCFHGRHELPLAPLTILVGENSTGKSTILAAIRLASDVAFRTLDLDFSEEPFDWGAYDQIAHYRRGREGRAKEFVIGMRLLVRPSRHPRGPQEVFLFEPDPRASTEPAKVRVEARFTQKGAQPRICEWSIESGQDSIVTRYGENGHNAAGVWKTGDDQHSFSFPAIRSPLTTLPPEIIFAGEVLGKVVMRDVRGLLFTMRKQVRQRPYAIAPIRTKPQRTYEPRRETPRPEGEHVPMILAAIRSASPDVWDSLKKDLGSFGESSGLFKSVDIKRLGTKESDPFQVQINIAGPPTNLVDVGYGISQVLPIAVDCLTSNRGQTLLMQQPEVHLHPRAQAELGSFMGYLVKSRKNRLVVETHSDYLIDRVRLDIRDGKHLRPEDVSILYCERKGLEVKVYPICIDAQGNLVDAPPGYRRFFLEEEKRFIEG